WGLRVVPCQGEKNHGFDVLYHNMKHGQISTKELADFVRERAAIEENYAKAMVKLSKMATNGTQLGTFAPLWEVFRISSDKLALCHLELMKKLHDLIKEISRYGEEQGRVHKKSKEEVSGTLEAVQLLHGVAQLLPKSKESYHSKCQEYERLRKEGTSQKEIDKAELKSKKAGEALQRAVEKYNAARADFEQRMLDSAMRFQEVEEAHLRHMKGLIGSYSHSVEDTHVQIGQVHEEFKQNVENIGTEMLLRRFAESKGTGRERPGEVVGDIPVAFPKLHEGDAPSCKDGARGGGERPPRARMVPRCQAHPAFGGRSVGFRRVPVDPSAGRQVPEGENHVCSSSDSDYDEDEPRKFYVHIKPVQPRDAGDSAEATVEQLKATVGNLILPPSIGVSLGVGCSPCPAQRSPPGGPARGTPSPLPHEEAGGRSGCGQQHRPGAWLGGWVRAAGTPMAGSEPSPPRPLTPSRPAVALAEPLALLELRPLALGARQPGRARLLRRLPAGARWVWGGGFGLWGGPIWALTPSASPGLSRGPSPVVLGSQDALPVATAFTEYVHAYFKGRDADSCLVKVTGELTMSFPAGIVRVFSGTVAPPVLSFRLLNTGAIEQFLPNADLLYSDPSQSDPSTRDFWLNMAALTGHLQKHAEQNPAASYYNVALLKYQFSRLGPGSAPLRLCARWDCSPGTTRVTVDYGYNAGALALPVPLTNVHVLLPVDEPIANLRLQPAASWYGGGGHTRTRGPKHPQGGRGGPWAGKWGCGRLSASWEPLCGPSKPSPVAAQFSSEGSTLSGVELELASTGYRMSLVKKRFATGTAGGC
ncbi:FCHO2 protein, partial [Corythaixoides concolor]|nr:FCHO2 protein [Corythaixoides concolor]